MTGTDKAGAALARVMALFEEAVSLEGRAREEFVESVRRDEPQLAGELASLLAVYEPGGDFLQPLDLGVVAAAFELDSDEDNVGKTVGAYRIVRELGRGGMGVVYVAERSDGQFDQKVALKLIKRGMDSDEIQRRFLNERQILAQLNHPNIARLLDGGVTDDGQPYFAMEYIEGLPLLEYCDSQRLRVADRLRLFLAICEAVKSAHAKLVVHLDIKPSNILVTPDGSARLLDFGIAKLIGTTAAATRTMERPLTPEYASPEQLRGGTVTTSSDVYQLGLLLYRLLTGVSPFADEPSKKRATTERGTEAPLPKPSSVVSATRIAACSLPPRRLARRLSGDLDNIILMALRAEPERRYESVAQLAGDVERHLARLPIIARQESAAYRAVKFVQRHTIGVIATAVVVVALLAGIAGTTWQARLAAAEAERAASTRDFALNLLALSDPDADRGGGLTVANLLATGAERVETELRGQPSLQADMLLVLGSVHRKLGDYEAAGVALERALALRRELFDDDDLPIAECLHELGQLRFEMSDFPAAEALFNDALAVRKKRLGDEDVAVADVLDGLAAIHRTRGEHDLATDLLETSLAIRRAALDPRHPAIAVSLSELGILNRHRGELDRALRYHEEALAIRRAAFGERHYRVAATLGNLALVYHSQDRFAEAEDHYRQALAIRRDVLGNDHPNTAKTLNSLASLLAVINRLDEAAQFFEEALAIQRTTLGDLDPSVARTLTNYGPLLFELGDFEKSLALLREALEIKRQTLGDDHPSTATSLNNLARVLGKLDRSEEALPLAQQAGNIYRQRLGPEHAFSAIALSNQALLELDTGRLEDAETHAIEANRILAGSPRDGGTMLAISQLRLGEVYLATGRPQLAEPLLQEATEQLRILDPEHLRILECENALGAALSALGKTIEGESFLLASHRAFKEQDVRQRRISLERLVAHYRTAGDADMAAHYQALLVDPGTTPP